MARTGELRGKADYTPRLPRKWLGEDKADDILWQPKQVASRMSPVPQRP